MDSVFREYLTLAGSLSTDQWHTPVGPNWNVKDVIAHLVGWEKECVRVLRQQWQEQAPAWFLLTDNYDDFNRKAVEQYRARSGPDLMEEWQRCATELQAEIAAIGEDNLRRRPELFGWAFDEGEYGHRAQHLRRIRKAIGG